MIVQFDIKKLQQAGVAADVILALLSDEDPAPADNAGGESPAVPAVPESVPDQPAAPAQPDPVLAAIERLTGAIQASNILNMGGSNAPARVTTEDVMRKLIGADAPQTK